MKMPLTSPSLRLVIWNDYSTTVTKFTGIDNLKFDSITGTTSSQTVAFVVSNNSESSGETFSSNGETVETSGAGPIFSIGGGVAPNKALLVFVESGNTLKITNTDTSNAITLSFGGTNALTIAAQKSITIEEGSILFVGGYMAKLTSKGLGSDNKPTTTSYTTDTVSIGGPGTLTVNNDIVLSGDTKIHIGRTAKNTDGATENPTTYIDSLEISNHIYTFTNTRLNIGSDGAAGNCSVLCSGTTTGDITVSGCTINVGGGKGETKFTGVGGAGGKGELTIGANITNSKIYCGSGGGGAGGYNANGSSNYNDGGSGGNGNISISSTVSNSYIFAGGAGGGAGSGGEGADGGDGNISISSAVSNSYIFAGSGGGAGSSGGNGGGSSGGMGGGYNMSFKGSAGGSNTLTISSGTELSGKVISFGLPASSGADIGQNITIGSISGSVIFCGCSNYGEAGSHGDPGAGGGNGSSYSNYNGGGGGAGGCAGGTNTGAGANVSLAYNLNGYLGQQLPFSFAGMTPGVLTLPTKPTSGFQTFQSIGTFPRYDCSAWKASDGSSLMPNLSNIVPTNITDSRNDKYASSPIYAAPIDGFITGADTFNCVIVNPAKAYDNKCEAASLVQISDNSVDIISSDINKTGNNVTGDWWVFNGTSTSKVASMVNLSKLQIGDAYEGISGAPLKINTKNGGILKFTGNTSKATAAGDSGITMIPGKTLTFDGCTTVVDVNGGSASGNTTFSGCTIDGLTMVEDTGSLTFTGSNIKGTTFGCFKSNSGVTSTISGCTFNNGCDLSTSSLKQCEFENVIFDAKVEDKGAVLKNTMKTTIKNQNADDKHITKDFNMDIAHNIEINGCTFGASGSLGKYDDSSVRDSNSTIVLKNSIINNVIKFGNLYDNGNNYSYTLEISGSTFNNLITFDNISDNISQNITIPIDNVSISMEGTISNLSPDGSMKYLSISQGVIEATQLASDTNAYHQLFKFTDTNDKLINLDISTNKDAKINYVNGFTMTGNPTISAPIFTNLRGQLILGEDLIFNNENTIGDDSNTVYVDTGSSLSLYRDKKYTIQSGTFSNVDLQEDYVLNDDLSHATVSKDGDLTVLTSTVQSGSEAPVYIQDNLTIATLTYGKDSILKYDSTDFVTNSMDISGLEIIISNNSLKNNSTTSDFTLPATFSLGDTTINNTNNYTLAAGMTLFVIGAGIYTLQGNITADTTILKGNLLETDENGFLIVPNDTYTGVTIGKLVIDGSLVLAAADPETSVKLKLENPMTIPQGTTVTITSSQVTLNYLPTFIGTNDITLIGSSYDFGNADFNNSSGSFSGFNNTSTFKMIYSNIASGKSIEIVNKGITEWYSASINPIDNGKLTINTGSMICPTTDTEGDILTFNGEEFEVGSLNIAPKGKLFLQCPTNASTVFKGTLQVNSVTYLGTTSQTVPPIASNNAATTLIINTSKYDSLHPFTGQIEMSAQLSNQSLLQINSSGAIRIKPSSKFVVSGYSENQKVIINGTFESIVEGAVYEYQKDLTLNGTIELERSAIIKGDLQITSSGRLFIGAGAGTVEGSEEVTASISQDSTPGSSATHIISISGNLYESANITIDTSTSGVTLAAPQDVSKIQPVQLLKASSIQYKILYADGLIVILYITTLSNPTVEIDNMNSSNTSPNTFFGPSSKVYISNSLEIFGEFYNNGQIDVNARLLCTASSSIINDGKIQVRGGNNNTIMGNVKIGNEGSLVFNGTYSDHSGHSLLINERGILTVNDSLMITTSTSQMIISPNSDPQICNVLINNDISTVEARYKISPQEGNTRAQVYIPINSAANLAGYKI